MAITLFSAVKIYKITLLCILLLFFVQVTQAQPPGRILFNSDFETPVLTPASPSPPRQSCSPATSCWYLTKESTVPGWNVIDFGTTSTDILDDNVEFWNSGFQGVPAQSGTQFIELNADKETPVFFEICMFSGETLTWSLWHRGRSGTDQMFLNVTDANNAPLFSQTISTGNTAWVNYQGNITNTGPNGAVRFTFRPGVTATGSPTVGNFIDNIQVLGLKPLVEFDRATYSAIENTVNLPRLLVNGTIPAGGATVTISAISGTATAGGVDYSYNANVFIPEGNYDGTIATSIPISLSIIDDLIVEAGGETINFSIVSATNPLLVNDSNCNGVVMNATLYTIGDNDVILPIELVSFSYKISEKVTLIWETSSENRSEYFAIERSEDGLEWKTIGKIPSTNTNSLKRYSFMDKNPLPNAYYRLKMVDNDHSYKFSKIIAVNFTDKIFSETPVLFPNPISKGEKLQIVLPIIPDIVQIQIDDVLGRNYANFSLKTKSNNISIAAPSMVGTYFVTIFYDNEVLKRKIIVQ